MTHFDQLSRLVPGLSRARILDVGAGEGAFAAEAAARGATVCAVDPYDAHLSSIRAQAATKGVAITVIHGVAEALPFPDASFDFVNMSEVLEHVENPARAVEEAFRVLAPDGRMYASVTNRYGMRDPHYGLWLVNWLPRRVGDMIAHRYGARKGPEEFRKGRQRLRDMHYFSQRQAGKLFVSAGFLIEDIRVLKIRSRAPAPFKPFALSVYCLLSPWYWDSFHFLLRKPSAAAI